MPHNAIISEFLCSAINLCNDFFFWRRRRDLFAFSRCENKGSAASSRSGQRSSALHLNCSNPTFAKRKSHPFGWLFFWRRRRDLNPRYPFGVYTISNRARSASYATSPCARSSYEQLGYITLFARICQPPKKKNAKTLQ